MKIIHGLTQDEKENTKIDREDVLKELYERRECGDDIESKIMALKDELYEKSKEDDIKVDNVRTATGNEILTHNREDYLGSLEDIYSARCHLLKLIGYRKHKKFESNPNLH
tara:strand:+ start:482 stop:814 length:333 start_codon:yes stop_codon:yes gene_type:complete